MVGFFATNIGLNVYLVTMLFFRSAQMSWMIFCLIGCFCAVQIIGPLLTVLPMLVCTNAAYRSARQLFPLLTRIKLRCLKYKFAAFYERLHTDKRITFNMGPLGKVTQKSIFEVS